MRKSRIAGIAGMFGLVAVLALSVSGVAAAAPASANQATMMVYNTGDNSWDGVLPTQFCINGGTTVTPTGELAWATRVLLHYEANHGGVVDYNSETGQYYPEGVQHKFPRGTDNDTEFGFVDETVADNGCAGAAPVPVSEGFLCYSHSEPDGGVSMTWDEASGIMAGTWAFQWTTAFLPSAIQGSMTGHPEVGSYYLTCDPPSNATPTTPVPLFHGGDGPGAYDTITPINSMVAGTFSYPILVVPGS